MLKTGTKNLPASIKEAQKEIEEITGVKRNENQVREFLKKTHSPLQEICTPFTNPNSSYLTTYNRNPLICK
jgi:hypothetical protein